MKPLINSIIFAAAITLLAGCASPRGGSEFDDTVGDAGTIPNGHAAAYGDVQHLSYPVGDYRNVLSDPGPF